jgi:mycofactocin precursor
VQLHYSESPQLSEVLLQNKPLFFLALPLQYPWEPPGASMRLCRKTFLKGRKSMEKKFENEVQELEKCKEEPKILEEIQVEELAIDGICGVY